MDIAWSDMKEKRFQKMAFDLQNQTIFMSSLHKESQNKLVDIILIHANHT